MGTENMEVRNGGGCFAWPFLLFGYKLEVISTIGMYDKAKNAIIPPHYNPISAAILRGEQTDVSNWTPKRFNTRIEIVPIEPIKTYSDKL